MKFVNELKGRNLNVGYSLPVMLTVSNRILDEIEARAYSSGLSVNDYIIHSGYNNPLIFQYNRIMEEITVEGIRLMWDLSHYYDQDFRRQVLEKYHAFRVYIRDKIARRFADCSPILYSNRICQGTDAQRAIPLAVTMMNVNKFDFESYAVVLETGLEEYLLFSAVYPYDAMIPINFEEAFGYLYEMMWMIGQNNCYPINTELGNRMIRLKNVFKESLDDIKAYLDDLRSQYHVNIEISEQS